MPIFYLKSTELLKLGVANFKYSQGLVQKVASTYEGTVTQEVHDKLIEALIIGEQIPDHMYYYSATVDPTKIKDFSIHSRFTDTYEEIKFIEDGILKNSVTINGTSHVVILVAAYDAAQDDYDMHIYLDTFVEGSQFIEVSYEKVE